MDGVLTPWRTIGYVCRTEPTRRIVDVDTFGNGRKRTKTSLYEDAGAVAAGDVLVLGPAAAAKVVGSVLPARGSRRSPARRLSDSQGKVWKGHLVQER